MALRSARIDSPGGIALLPVRPPYHLYRTLGCGQAFRWRIDAAGATGVFMGKRVRLSQTSDGIACEGLTEESALHDLRHYLGLDEPLESIEGVLRQDPVLERVLPATSGLALLHQEPWECLISFIISAFNNIPKIELSLHRLGRQFGEQVDEGAWAFPSPEQLAGASLRDLRRCALGYRGPYVRDVSRRVVSGDVDLQAIEREEYLPARRILLALPGVGEKVADCVLLFAYAKGEAFPVDVWVKRAVERWYFGGRRKTERQIREFARERFGPLAGYAQQHLFHSIRNAGRRMRPRKPSQS
jgi:N-glycosylase/DNA lyase